MGRKISLLALVLLAGIGVILGSRSFQQRTTRQVERMLQTHVNTVAHLAKASVSQGVWSTSTTYTLYEDRLLTVAHLFSVLDEARLLNNDIRSAEAVALHFSLLSSNDPADIWGARSSSTLTELQQVLRKAPSYELLEGSFFRRHKLVCMVYEISTDRGAVCLNDSEFQKQKNVSGIGNLLSSLSNRGVTYIALQDQTGILAVSPADAYLSRWKDDPALQNILHSDKNIVRESNIHRTPHFEGLYPFKMADGSTVVMRVAIDASVFEQVKKNASRRHGVIVSLVVALELLSIAIIALIWHTQKKQVDTEHRLRQQKEERKHWALIGELSATVAHEIRNPLNAIGMTTQRLQYEFSVPESEKEDFEHLLKVLRTESEQLNRIVTDFLELGKPIQLKIEATRLNPFIQQTVSPFLLRAEQQHKTISVDIADTLTVPIDTQRFAQIIANLVGNALDAIDGDGTVHIHAVQNGHEIILQVDDNGTGLASDQLDEVLKPFVSYKANGTGLGLALVNRFVKLHNGTFTLQNNPKNGLSAVIHLPQSRKDIS
ncbi:MAG: hypothetical protein JXX29_10585 [Deltaproteobacteria bacterium]|nr:hypothetical protein [Deltaproteobacteria bacterium]MBN2672114.1 hypothetical protein [Deltaproteobacteria bacterium]